MTSLVTNGGLGRVCAARIDRLRGVGSIVDNAKTGMRESVDINQDHFNFGRHRRFGNLSK